MCVEKENEAHGVSRKQSCEPEKCFRGIRDRVWAGNQTKGTEERAGVDQTTGATCGAHSQAFTRAQDLAACVISIPEEDTSAGDLLGDASRTVSVGVLSACEGQNGRDW